MIIPVAGVIGRPSAVGSKKTAAKSAPLVLPSSVSTSTILLQV
jgi:hypothetical protein